jgi:molybdenum cofactor synthesis domain-containing protein
VPPARQESVVNTAAALLIGNELLSGKVREANLFELAHTLRALGVQLQRVVMVSDDVEAIAAEVALLSRQHDVVFTSGGVGPTHDDVTIEAVARAFGVATHVDPSVAKLLSDAYGEACSEAHLRMALVPDGACLTTDDEVPWPTVVMRNVWMLPGVPEVFRMKLSVIRSTLRGPAPFLSRAVFTRLDEADLKPLLDQVVAAYADVEVGSYPKWFDPSYKTKVTFDARKSERLESAVSAFMDLIPREAVIRVE